MFPGVPAIHVSYTNIWVPTNAGPVINPLPNMPGGGRMLGLAMTVAHLHADGTIGSAHDIAIGTNPGGAATIIESLLFAAESAGVVPALRSQRDQYAAAMKRLR